MKKYYSIFLKFYACVFLNGAVLASESYDNVDVDSSEARAVLGYESEEEETYEHKIHKCNLIEDHFRSEINCDSDGDENIENDGNFVKLKFIEAKKHRENEENVESFKRVLYFLDRIESTISKNEDPNSQELVNEDPDSQEMVSAAPSRKIGNYVVSRLKGHFKNVILEKEGMEKTESEVNIIQERTYRGWLSQITQILDKSLLSSENRGTLKQAIVDLDSINAGVHLYGANLASFPPGLLNDIQVICDDTVDRTCNHLYHYRIPYAGASIIISVVMIKAVNQLTSLMADNAFVMASVAGVGVIAFFAYQDSKIPGTYCHYFAAWAKNRTGHAWDADHQHND